MRCNVRTVNGPSLSPLRFVPTVKTVKPFHSTLGIKRENILNLLNEMQFTDCQRTDYYYYSLSDRTDRHVALTGCISASILDNPRIQMRQFVAFLEFGWPISFDYSRILTLNSSNLRSHKGAQGVSSAVDSYSEISFGSVCGPFARNPVLGTYERPHIWDLTYGRVRVKFISETRLKIVSIFTLVGRAP